MKTLAFTVVIAAVLAAAAMPLQAANPRFKVAKVEEVKPAQQVVLVDGRDDLLDAHGRLRNRPEGIQRFEVKRAWKNFTWRSL